MRANKWYDDNKDLNLLVEYVLDPHLEDDSRLQISSLFASLGWKGILHLGLTFYPYLVKESYANITHKENKQAKAPPVIAFGEKASFIISIKASGK